MFLRSSSALLGAGFAAPFTLALDPRSSSAPRKRTLIVSLLLTIVPVVWLYFSQSRLEFYFIGALAGFQATKAGPTKASISTI